MLADPTFAEMVQAIGEASLGADDKAIWHLTKVTPTAGLYFNFHMSPSRWDLCEQTVQGSTKILLPILLATNSTASKLHSRRRELPAVAWRLAVLSVCVPHSSRVCLGLLRAELCWVRAAGVLVHC